MRSMGITNFAPWNSAPPVGPEGDSYYNTVEDIIYVSDGVQWVPIGSVASTDPRNGTLQSVGTSINSSAVGTTRIPLTGGPITVVAVPFDRLMIARSINLFSAATAQHDYWIEGCGSIVRNRYTGPTAGHHETALATLAANTSATINVSVSSVSGTLTLATAGASDLNRLDVMTIPKLSGNVSDGLTVSTLSALPTPLFDGQRAYIIDEASVVVASGGTWYWYDKNFPTAYGSNPAWLTWATGAANPVILANCAATLAITSGKNLMMSIQGQVTTAVAALNQVCATLTAGYRPSGTITFSGGMAISSGGWAMRNIVNNAGSCQIVWINAPTAGAQFFSNMQFSVANLIAAV